MDHRAFLFLLGVALTACAQQREPLPGDSVKTDGAVAVAPARAQPIQPKEALGAIESRVFPPEMLMERQAELGIDEKQRASIVAETERAQTEMTKLRWDLERDREALAKLLDAEPVDETAVAATAKRLTDVESRMKAVHLGMLVRIKNLLTPGQKQKLRQNRGN